MKGREGGRTANTPTDLLVCFPSRSRLALMPKPICSPARAAEGSKRHHSRSVNRGQASPLFRTKSNPSGLEISEPTSPKVTCAGQIKVRKKASSCKNWQSVMKEIERLHNDRKQSKKPSWLEAVGFKKDIMQFLTAFRGLRFDLRCFGSFHHGSVDDSDRCSDDEDEEEDQENDVKEDDSRTIFSKWFMILQETQNHGLVKEEEVEEREKVRGGSVKEEESVAPPKNALLLMRCRSAPTKRFLEEKEGEEEEEAERAVTIKLEEEKKKKEEVIVMSYAPDFFKVSSDIAKETWIVGSTDPFARSRSWRR